MQTAGQAQNSHDLRSNGNIKTVLTRYAMRFAAQSDNNITQLAVIHINNTFPNDPTRVDIQSIALLHMVIDHCRKQHVCRCDRMEITCKMQVDIFHRHHLRITAAGCAALNAHAGSQRRLAQSHDNAFINFGQALGQSYGSSRLAFPCRRRCNSRYQNQLARRFIFHAADQIHR